MNVRNIAITLAVWLGLTCGIAYVLGSDNLMRYRALSLRGIETIATVHEKQPQNHRFVRYSYTFSGQTYEGLGRLGKGNPDFDQLKVGDQLKAYVDPQNPTNSILGEPQTRFSNELISVGLAAVVFPLLIIGVLLAKGVLPHWTNRQARAPN